LPQVNNDADEYQNHEYTHGYRSCEYPHKAFILPGDNVFEIPVARGESLVHLDDAVGLFCVALV
jgi:hypothetical protein